MNKRTNLLLLCFVVLLVTAACDPNKIINQYFAQLGLNRLAVLRNDIQPGGLILVGKQGGKQGALYADNMLDYVTSSDETSIPVSVRNGTSDFDAVIAGYSGDRKVNPTAALNFIKQVLPSLSGKVNLTASVKLDQIEAKVKRMKIDDVRKFLVSDAANGFKAELDTEMKENQTPYLVYEVWSTNKLKLTSDGGTDISASIKVGAVGKVASANGSITYTKTDKTTLEISGSEYYVFAVRTGKLQKNGTGYDFVDTQFAPASGAGVKAAGTDVKYSSLVDPEGVLSLQ